MGFNCYLIALFSKGLFGYSRIGFNFSCSVCKPSAKREREKSAHTHKQTPDKSPNPRKTKNRQFITTEKNPKKMYEKQHGKQVNYDKVLTADSVITRLDLHGISC